MKCTVYWSLWHSSSLIIGTCLPTVPWSHWMHAQISWQTCHREWLIVGLYTNIYYHICNLGKLSLCRQGVVRFRQRSSHSLLKFVRIAWFSWMAGKHWSHYFQNLRRSMECSGSRGMLWAHQCYDSEAQLFSALGKLCWSWYNMCLPVNNKKTWVDINLVSLDSSCAYSC